VTARSTIEQEPDATGSRVAPRGAPAAHALGGSVAIGIDIGGTKTLAVAVDDRAEVIASSLLATDATSPDSVVATGVHAARRVLAQLGATTDEVRIVGAGVPGRVHHLRGTVVHAVNLGIGDEPLDLGRRLSDALGARVVLENDVNAAALGAVATVAPAGVDDIAYLSVGTGVAAGLVLGGRLRRGAHGMAGEIGHLSIDPDGPPCACGQRGCLEQVASGAAIARMWPGDGETSPTQDLFRSAALGDARAIAIRDRLAQHLAGAVLMLVHTVDPDLVVIGGGVAEIGQPLRDALVSALEARAASVPFMRALRLSERVRLVPPDRPVGAIGAALAAVAAQGTSA
jgi:predicted NBD/HSP70 family sugar kinase